MLLRDEPPYGALNYGTSFLYLRDSELRDGDAYGTSLLTGLFNYRTLHKEGRQRELTGRRGEGAYGTSPLVRDSELRDEL